MFSDTTFVNDIFVPLLLSNLPALRFVLSSI